MECWPALGCGALVLRSVATGPPFVDVVEDVPALATSANRLDGKRHYGAFARSGWYT